MHEGICGAHKSDSKMRWLIHRYRYYWPTISAYCLADAKGYEACQVHGPLEKVTAKKLHVIVKPWWFRGWAIDLFVMIHPPSSKRHTFIIVGINYFTKCVEAQPLVNVTQADVIGFIKTQIIYWFGVPETITMDQGTMFMGEKIKAFPQ